MSQTYTSSTTSFLMDNRQLANPIDIYSCSCQQLLTSPVPPWFTVKLQTLLGFQTVEFGIQPRTNSMSNFYCELSVLQLQEWVIRKIVGSWSCCIVEKPWLFRSERNCVAEMNGMLCTMTSEALTEFTLFPLDGSVCLIIERQMAFVSSCSAT